MTGPPNEDAPVAAGAYERTNQKIRNLHHNPFHTGGCLELLADAFPPDLDPIRCHSSVSRPAVRVLGPLTPPRMSMLLLALVRDGASSAVGVDTNSRIHVAQGRSSNV